MSLDTHSIQLINQMIYEVTIDTEDFPEEAFDDDFAGEKPTMEETQVIIKKITENMETLSFFNCSIGDHLEEIIHMSYKDVYLYIKEKNIRYITLFKNVSFMKSSSDSVKKSFGYIKGLFMKLISKIVSSNVDETIIKLNNLYEFIGNAIKYASQCILSKKKGGFFEELLTIGTCVLGGAMSAIKRYIEPDKLIITENNQVLSSEEIMIETYDLYSHARSTKGTLQLVNSSNNKNIDDLLKILKENKFNITRDITTNDRYQISHYYRPENHYNFIYCYDTPARIEKSEHGWANEMRKFDIYSFDSEVIIFELLIKIENCGGYVSAWKDNLTSEFKYLQTRYDSTSSELRISCPIFISENDKLNLNKLLFLFVGTFYNMYCEYNIFSNQDSYNGYFPDDDDDDDGGYNTYNVYNDSEVDEDYAESTPEYWDHMYSLAEDKPDKKSNRKKEDSNEKPVTINKSDIKEWLRGKYTAFNEAYDKYLKEMKKEEREKEFLDGMTADDYFAMNESELDW